MRDTNGCTLHVFHMVYQMFCPLFWVLTFHLHKGILCITHFQVQKLREFNVRNAWLLYDSYHQLRHYYRQEQQLLLWEESHVECSNFVVNHKIPGKK